MARSETAQLIVEELETRVRIAERQGWTNRNVPVQLLRQAAEELRDLLALVGAETPQQWQPIETAPKDGTWIIVRMGNGQVWKASWGRDRQNEMHWCTDVLSLAGCRVTHWMPLPSPPVGAPPPQETET